MSLTVSESGTKGAPTIVFMHGAGLSGWMWQAQIDTLQDFHCLNIDLPGHGKSNHIPWVSMADTANQVAALIHDRATNQKAHVVGLSLGAYVTTALLANHTACVDRAVISGMTAFPLPRATLMKMQMFFMSYLMQNPWFIKQQARMLQMPEDVIPYYFESMRAMSRQTFMQIFNELLYYRLPANLNRAQVSTLVTAGSLEMPLILESIPEITRSLPRAESRLAEGGHHGWNGEAPELFSSMIRAWITETPLPEGLITPQMA